MLKYFKYRMAPISSVQSVASDFRIFHHTWINETTGRLKGISKWASETIKSVRFFLYGEKILEFLVFIIQSVCGSLACGWIYAFGGGHALQRWDCSIGDSPQRCCCQICVFSSILRWHDLTVHLRVFTTDHSIFWTFKSCFHMVKEVKGLPPSVV